MRLKRVNHLKGKWLFFFLLHKVGCFSGLEEMGEELAHIEVVLAGEYFTC